MQRIWYYAQRSRQRSPISGTDHFPLFAVRLITSEAAYMLAVTKETLIRLLNLHPHQAEGGYYSEQYTSGSWMLTDGRPAIDTIYYMLTDDSPVGYFHLNKSVIVHFYHAGDPLKYTIIEPSGRVDTFVLGPDLAKGHELQRAVEGGCWKATQLMGGTFGLISEAVVPAFSPEDRTIARRAELLKLFPDLDEQLLDLVWD
jgi:uncharacterized protein